VTGRRKGMRYYRPLSDKTVKTTMHLGVVEGFAIQKRGDGFTEIAACERWIDVAFLTLDPLEVTCALCKKTRAYLDRPLPYVPAKM
jgi:hypothetical protein